MPSADRDSTSLISRSSPSEFEYIFTSNFGRNYLKSKVERYNTQKCTLEYLQNILDDQQDADSDEGKQDTDADEDVKKQKVDYDELGESIVSKILTSHKPVHYTAEATNTTTIEQYKELLVPTISSAIKPDISIKDSKGNKILHIEVLSETLVKMIRKLFFDLLLQLLYIRSVNKAVFEVSGFVLPAGKKNYIVLATVRWNPTQFKFIGESEALSPGSFLQKLFDTIATQETYFGDLTPSHKTKYVSHCKCIKGSATPD